MNVDRGDIVLIDYPHSRGGGTKVRPVLVIQNDHDNRRLVNTIIAQITSRTDRTDREPVQLLVDLATPAGQKSGLRTNSVVNCANLFTVHRDDVLRKLGNLPAAMMRQVDECLRKALDVK
ncbi:MAG: type II toxin-antitoxin system PemK/MazF family toxin [Planctomycetes bacterium]|nr:type II toxin-antitoxin system PemK/MazF family toxin [Planctomycetota bacterium]